MQKDWGRQITGYMNSRDSLRAIILIMDIRHPFQKTDLDFLAWCRQYELPVQLLLNKADKLSNNQAGQSLAAAQRAAQEYPEIEHLQICSAEKGNGLEALGSFITS